MINICISMTSHALDPLPRPQTVTPSRTPPPSSVTYSMDGPYKGLCLCLLLVSTTHSAYVYSAYSVIINNLHKRCPNRVFIYLQTDRKQQAYVYNHSIDGRS